MALLHTVALNGNYTGRIVLVLSDISHPSGICVTRFVKGGLLSNALGYLTFSLEFEKIYIYSSCLCCPTVWEFDCTFIDYPAATQELQKLKKEDND